MFSRAGSLLPSMYADARAVLMTSSHSEGRLRFWNEKFKRLVLPYLVVLVVLEPGINGVTNTYFVPGGDATPHAQWSYFPDPGKSTLESMHTGPAA